jgi:hypothetical protein
VEWYIFTKKKVAYPFFFVYFHNTWYTKAMQIVSCHITKIPTAGTSIFTIEHMNNMNKRKVDSEIHSRL